MSDAADAARAVVEVYVDPASVTNRAVAAQGRQQKAARPKQRGRTGVVQPFNQAHPRGHGGKFAVKQGGTQQAAQTQDTLRQQGMYGGQVDGLAGPKTQAAVKAFQAKYGLAQTGKVDASTAATLQAPPPKTAAAAQSEVDAAVAAADAAAAKKAQAAQKATQKTKAKKSAASAAGGSGGGGSGSGALSPVGVLRKGDGMAMNSKGEAKRKRGNGEVKQLQTQLQALGFDIGESGVDGRFGGATEAAVKKMQAFYGLTPDGVVGRKTKLLLALLQSAESQRSNDPNALSIDQMGLVPAPKKSSAAAAAALATSGGKVTESAAANAAVASIRAVRTADLR